MKLTFLGAAREVTGSSYLIEREGVRLLVDCGMFQGGSETRAKYHQAFAFNPATIDFVLMTAPHRIAELLSQFRSKPRQVFVVHGEESIATGFAADLKIKFGWDTMAPPPGHSVSLD